MTLFRNLLAALILVSLCSNPALAEDKKKGAPAVDGPVSYYRHIRPIFQAACFGCHQPAKSQGSLDMTNFQGLLDGGDSEDAMVVAGKPDEGTLLEMIVAEEGDTPEMPKDGKPLSADQITLIRRWITEGAKNDTPNADAAVYDADHPPKYQASPVLTSITFSPDGKLLAVSGYHEVLLHEVDLTGKTPPKMVARLVGLSERIESAVFSPDGKRLAVTGGSPGRLGEVQIWDVEKRELIRSVSVTFDTVYGASWSPDGKLIGFGCSDNTLRAINAETGEQVFYQQTHNGWVLDSIFSVKGTHLVSVSRDMTMKLNEVATQRFVDNVTSITPGALKGGLYSVDRHPTADQLLIGGADGTPKLYKMFRTKARVIGDDFNLIRKFPAMPGRVFTVSFSPDAKYVVAGSSKDGQGEVWVFTTADGILVAKMQGIEGGVFSASFSPDSKTVVSGGYAGEVLLHDGTTGKLIQKFVPVPLGEDSNIAEAKK